MTDQPGQQPPPSGEGERSGTAADPAPAPSTPPGPPAERTPPAPSPPGQAGPPGQIEVAGRNALWMSVAGLALTLLANLWGALAGLVLSAAAVVIGFRTRRQAKRGRTVSTGADVGIAVGGVGVAFALFVVGMSAVLYREMTGYNQCLEVANTHSDRDACKDDFLRGVERKFGTPPGQLERSPLFGLTGGARD